MKFLEDLLAWRAFIHIRGGSESMHTSLNPHYGLAGILAIAVVVIPSVVRRLDDLVIDLARVIPAGPTASP